VTRPTVWQRRMLWVWNAANDPKTTQQWIAANAARLGFATVVVKVHDGGSVFHGPEGANADPRYYKALRDAGLTVGGWGWLEGDGEDARQQGGVEEEASRAAERCRTLGLSFYIADPESVYEFSPRDSPTPGVGRTRFGYSRRFVSHFAAAIRDRRFPRAVASFGRCDLHDLDWHAWATPGPDGYTWRCAMQAYANCGHALDVELCVRAALPYWKRALVHPTIGVYSCDLGRLDPRTYAAQLARAGTVGFGLYSLDSVREAQLPGYGRIQAAR